MDLKNTGRITLTRVPDTANYVKFVGRYGNEELRLYLQRDLNTVKLASRMEVIVDIVNAEPVGLQRWVLPNPQERAEIRFKALSAQLYQIEEAIKELKPKRRALRRKSK